MPFFPLSQIFASIISPIARIVKIRFDQSRINSTERLVEFVHTRAAYVAQVSLYGYLKTRMGTQYRVIFEDKAFAGSLNTAKWRTYTACLADLSIFAVATVARDARGIPLAPLAQYCFTEAVRATFDGCDVPRLEQEAIQRFALRADTTDWRLAGDRDHAFGTSPQALIDAAPVTDEFKRLDREIVINSIRFRWRDIRAQLRKRIDAEAICAEWRSGTVAARKPS